MIDRHADLLAMLRTLKLPAMAAAFPGRPLGSIALKAAKNGLTHEAFLYDLVQLRVRPTRRAADRPTPAPFRPAA